VIAHAVLAALVVAQVVPPPAVSTVSGATVVRQRDAASPLAGVELFVRAGLDRQTLSQNGLAALTAESILQTPVTAAPGDAPRPLQDAVAAMGGSISFGVSPSDVHFYIEGLAEDQDALVGLLSQALAAPALDGATIASARTVLDANIANDDRLPFQVGMDMLDRQFFGNANQGLPQYGTATALAQFVAADVRGFYTRYYRRDGAVISAVGPPTAFASSAIERLAGTLGPGRSTAVAAKVAALQGTSRELIARRDIGAPWMLAQFSAPAVGSKDFAAMLVLAALVDRGLQETAQVPTAVSRGIADGVVGTIYNYDQKPASLVIYVDGGLGDASTTFSNTLAFVKVINTVKLSGSFDEFKALARGNYIAGSDRIADRAWLAGVFAGNGASPNYLNQTLAEIAAVTPADVARVARKYLGKPAIALVVPRASATQ